MFIVYNSETFISFRNVKFFEISNKFIDALNFRNDNVLLLLFKIFENLPSNKLS